MSSSSQTVYSSEHLAESNTIAYRDRAQFPFLSLPGEVRDGIYEAALIFAEPIEFAPFNDDRGLVYHENFDIYQYQHASRYRQDIRPMLKLLRVCKQINREAFHIYYSKNHFRFSNVTGWIVLQRFLNLIGPRNRSLLRDITVCHPGLTWWPGGRWNAEEEHLKVRYLAPFCMIDTIRLDDSQEIHEILSTGSVKELVGKSLQMLRQVSGLQQLRLLVYGNTVSELGDRDQHTWQIFTHWGGHQGVLDTEEIALFSKACEQQTELNISFVHLTPGFGHHSFFTLEYIKSADLFVIDDPDLVEAVLGAKRVYDNVKERSWQVDQMMYGECGYFSLDPAGVQSHTNPCSVCAQGVEAFQDLEHYEHMRFGIGTPTWPVCLQSSAGRLDTCSCVGAGVHIPEHLRCQSWQCWDGAALEHLKQLAYEERLLHGEW